MYYFITSSHTDRFASLLSPLTELFVEIKVISKLITHNAPQAEIINNNYGTDLRIFIPPILMPVAGYDPGSLSLTFVTQDLSP
jgi:hypothetical protein